MPHTASLYDFLNANAYVLVFLLSAAVGASEIVSRYKQARFRALLTVPSLLILLLNGLVSVLALFIISLLDANPDTAIFDDTPLRTTYEILLAGIGGLAFLRSSLFKVRVGDADIPFGPSAFLEILQIAADRTLDRELAEPRARRVHAIMIGEEGGGAMQLSFDQTKETLPTFCFALMQNVPAEEQQSVSLQVEALASSNMPEQIKVMNLGLILLDVVGEKVLRTAVERLRLYIGTPSSDLDIVEEAIGELTAQDIMARVATLAMTLERTGEEEREAFAIEATSVGQLTLDEETKRRILALELMRTVGQESFKKAALSVRATKAAGAPPADGSPPASDSDGPPGEPGDGSRRQASGDGASA